MPSEESNKERALQCVERALAALPPEEKAAQFMTTGWAAAVRNLVEAVRLLADPNPPLVLRLDLDEYGPGQLEQINERINAAREPTFVISFPSAVLKVSEIWPEVNEEPAPENPTAEDVVEVMKNYSEYSSPLSVAGEWLLIEELSVRKEDDEEDSVVFWAG